MLDIDHHAIPANPKTRTRSLSYRFLYLFDRFKGVLLADAAEIIGA
ncbi:hypothetical protein [Limoniibacter endophyticus]|nr:hypothetical protein [Limoniibacter endophyticus]